LEKLNIYIKSKLIISRKAHLILPTHRLLDAASETAKGKAKIGSTLKGIGPTYMDKTGRNGLRVGDIELSDFKERYRTLADKHEAMIKFYDVAIQYNLAELEKEFFDAIGELKKLDFIDSEAYLHEAQKSGKTILCEGAQGSLLDVDFGTYPFVTSSNTTAAGACTGLGIAPNKIKEVYGIFKAYTTRVGSGPFPTEDFGEAGDIMAKVGNEFGSVTGRKRRCGWLDLVALKYAIQINGVTQLMMMKGDVLSGFKTLKVCTAYKYNGGSSNSEQAKQIINHLPYNIEPENVAPIYTELKGWNNDLTGMTSYDQLPKELTQYIEFIENAVEVPIKIVSVGPDRKQTIMK
jgi:adenylosuccinate synthase